MTATDDSAVLIAGAGPAGLTAAYELAKRGAIPIVFEKDALVGGHARTETFQGYRFDIGGHRFFTKIPEVEQIWHNVTGDALLRVPRLSRIYYNKKFFYYPLRAANVLAGLGLWNSLQIGLSFLAAALVPLAPEDNFERWTINRFGRRLYEAFFKTYTEKVWGIPCDQISAEWAAQRIRGLSLRTVVMNTVLGNQKKKIKSLIDEFLYPRLGPGLLWERVQQHVTQHGGEVHLRHEVLKIHRAGRRVLGFTVADSRGPRFVEGWQHIASMPITHVVNRLDPPPPQEVIEAASQLKYRDFLTVCLIVDQPNVFPDNWIYIHDPEIKMGRLQNFKNWSPSMVPDLRKTSLGAEYFSSEGDALWEMADADLVALAARELEEMAITRKELVEAGVVYRQKYAYPVYDKSYKLYLDRLEDFFKGLENFQMIGRNGLHKYNNQDHSMLTAILAVQNIYGANHDVWKVNTDELYHEEAVESET